MLFRVPEGFALSVACGDSSPKGRAKGAGRYAAVFVEKLVQNEQFQSLP